MRTMYDSVTAGDIPTNAKMVAGYVSGKWKWSQSDWARFPNAVKVRIATQASVNDGVVLDVEPGDATPAQAPGWVTMRRAAGVDPTVYCGLTSLPAVQAAFTAAHVAQPHYWVARYDNSPTLPAGVVAKQYINPPTSGGHYDLSAVVDYWPGVDPAPIEGPDMDSTQSAQLAYIASVLGRYPVGLVNGKNGPDGIWTGDAAEFARRIDANVTALAARVQTITTVAPTVDLDALAAKLAPLLAPAVIAALAANLATPPAGGTK